MPQCERIVYISRAAFAANNPSSAVEPEIGRILMQSRRNNPSRGLVGVLYYGDGHFFQVLEGERAAIDALLGTLLQDTRHGDLTVLSRHAIGQPSFAGWSMKYVPASDDVKKLLASFGQSRFDPYQFDDAQIGAMIALLQQRSAASEPAAAEAPSEPRRSISDDHEQAGRRARYALWISVIALLLSMISMMMAILIYRRGILP
ncbi:MULTISPECIES: BLUF domain-containing protein [Rhodanobacter]|jgi:hypothetical protein|uniref:Sensors of blue-light using FAD n=1 Tax=Rhodanobacter glycinis TaxID=582702 RepID=A0A1I4DK70_9GAMM|nr:MULTISPECIES: BLUF domain-containing protein [Rhodanobacter]EIL98088.1 BLUF domain-containing protein [Rhodanobacter sp. 115]SFK93140.1 Sensors of blue-light using FAD [Rhodanobacter glycinis]